MNDDVKALLTHARLQMHTMDREQMSAKERLIADLATALETQEAKITESLRHHVIAPDQYPVTRRTGPRPPLCQYDGEPWPCRTVLPFIEKPTSFIKEESGWTR